MNNRQFEPAEQSFRQALSMQPGHRDALLGLSFLMRETGRHFEAAGLLYTLVERHPGEATVHHRLGMTLMTAGRLRESLIHLRLACQLERTNPHFRLSLGTALLLAGHTGEAQESFQMAMLADNSLGAAMADPRTPFPLRRDLQLAQLTLAAMFSGFNEQTLDEVAAAFPGADLDRLTRGLGCLVGDRPPFTNPLRKGAQLYLPDIPELPWVDAQSIPWTAAVLERQDEIRRELDALFSADESFVPYVAAAAGESATGTDVDDLRGSMAWNSYHLYKNGTRIDAHCERCPVTAGIFDKAPIPRIRHHSPEIFFSRLRPGAHIRPHFGLMNIRLTLHLPLVIPADCGITVAGETRQWRHGEILAFDDSFEHEAWNHSAEERVVLIFEAWHPAVTAAEKMGIERVFELRRDWLDRFDG